MAEIVVSVPHSGTRALCAHLGIYALEQGLGHSGHGQWWHFGNPAHWRMLMERPEVFVHIPIRNPLDVAASWARRGKQLSHMLRHFEQMMRFLDGATHDRATYQMELLPRHEVSTETSRLPAYPDTAVLDALKPYADFYAGFYG